MASAKNRKPAANHDDNAADLSVSIEDIKASISEFTTPELVDLQATLASVITVRKAADREAATRDVAALLREKYGEDISFISASKVKPKYRNPQDHTQTWSGRGAKPRWLVKALSEEGAKIEDFKIEADEEEHQQAA